MFKSNMMQLNFLEHPTSNTGGIGMEFSGRVQTTLYNKTVNICFGVLTQVPVKTRLSDIFIFFNLPVPILLAVSLHGLHQLHVGLHQSSLSVFTCKSKGFFIFGLIGDALQLSTNWMGLVQYPQYLNSQ